MFDTAENMDRRSKCIPEVKLGLDPSGKTVVDCSVKLNENSGKW
jgi:hypothetical protein